MESNEYHELVSNFLKNQHPSGHVKINFKIHEDQTVDINSFISLAKLQFFELPFKFNISRGTFDISECNFTSLINSPIEVHGCFDCSYNKIQSLQFCPKFVEGNFNCHDNLISPWEHRYLLFSEIQREIRTGNSKLNAFFKLYQNKKALIPEALKELRELQIQWEQENA